ncbi:pentapeptide repeat-containing protein [candidate division KSB1 bacterium]
MDSAKSDEKKNISCCYIRRDNTQCPEPRTDDSAYCFWHNEKIPKDGEDIKEKLEKKVKTDSNCEGYILTKAKLNDVWLTEANFNDAIFRKAQVKKGHCFGISLKGADLFKAKFTGANLRHAKLNEANLIGTNFENSRIENINWGRESKVLQEIQANIAHIHGRKKVAKSKYKDAEEIYISLKNHFNVTGQSKMVGQFFYREMIAHRKQLSMFSLQRIFSKLADVSCGYGEKVKNIFLFSLLVIFVNAVFYSFAGVSSGDTYYSFSISVPLWDNVKTFFMMLYYSIVTFTTLGYGDISPASPISRLLAGIEAFVGAFLVALFVISVYKNMMSR